MSTFVTLFLVILHPQMPGIVPDLMIFRWTLVHSVLGQDLRFRGVEWVCGPHVLGMASPRGISTSPKICLQSLQLIGRSIHWKEGDDLWCSSCSSQFWTWTTLCEAMMDGPWSLCVSSVSWNFSRVFLGWITDGPFLPLGWSVTLTNGLW
jgi:hypothetical protein